MQYPGPEGKIRKAFSCEHLQARICHQTSPLWKLPFLHYGQGLHWAPHKILFRSFVLQKLAPALLESHLLSENLSFSVNTANKIQYFFMRLQNVALRLLTNG